jgi:hypothetical protein
MPDFTLHLSLPKRALLFMLLVHGMTFYQLLQLTGMQIAAGWLLLAALHIVLFIRAQAAFSAIHFSAERIRLKPAMQSDCLIVQAGADTRLLACCACLVLIDEGNTRHRLFVERSRLQGDNWRRMHLYFRLGPQRPGR